MDLPATLVIKTTEMHTGGEPLRIIESGYPEILGQTILDKRRYVKEHLDALRKFLMWEPRGHYDMYGALLVKPDVDKADIAVLFLHNEGYSTMCGHAVISLGRYAIDKGIVKNPTSPECCVNIQCPCGLVQCYVEYHEGKTGNVRFQSVPAYVFALDLNITLEKYGELAVDICYGGAFYAILPAKKLMLDVRTSSIKDIVEAATLITKSVKRSIQLTHPENEDLAFLYGTILTDGNEEYPNTPTANICIFADQQTDRSPCGSGVTARVAQQHARGLITRKQKRIFQNGATGSQFTGEVVSTLKYHDLDAVIVEVGGKGNYTGENTFILEEDDCLKKGFVLK